MPSAGRPGEHNPWLSTAWTLYIHTPYSMWHMHRQMTSLTCNASGQGSTQNTAWLEGGALLTVYSTTLTATSLHSSASEAPRSRK